MYVSRLPVLDDYGYLIQTEIHTNTKAIVFRLVTAYHWFTRECGWVDLTSDHCAESVYKVSAKRAWRIQLSYWLLCLFVLDSDSFIHRQISRTLWLSDVS